MRLIFLLLLAACASLDPFTKLKPGMTQNEVISSIGLPEDRVKRPAREEWLYGLRDPGGTRTLVFDGNRLVSVGSPVVRPSGNTMNVRPPNPACQHHNQYGSYPQDGGCNAFGCWPAGGSCNVFGCSASGQCSTSGCPASIPSVSCQ